MVIRKQLKVAEKQEDEYINFLILIINIDCLKEISYANINTFWLFSEMGYSKGYLSISKMYIHN